ncbi:hypothetical protein VTH06DRAFT_3797 [Thermothelomyces fergusii]
MAGTLAEALAWPWQPGPIGARRVSLGRHAPARPPQVTADAGRRGQQREHRPPRAGCRPGPNRTTCLPSRAKTRQVIAKPWCSRAKGWAAPVLPTTPAPWSHAFAQTAQKCPGPVIPRPPAAPCSSSAAALATSTE